MTTMACKRHILALPLVCAALIACARDVAPERLRLITVVPDRLFEPWDLARVVPLTEDEWGRQAGARRPTWRPIELDGTWRQGESLEIEPQGTHFALKLPTRFDAAMLDTLEVVVATGYRLQVELQWKAQGAVHRLAPRSPQIFSDDGRRTIRFLLRGEPGWAGSIHGLRLDFELGIASRIAVTEIRGSHIQLDEPLLRAHLEEAWRVEQADEVRNAVLVAPEYPASWRVHVPPRASLRFGLAATGRLGSPLAFRIVAESEGGESKSMLYESILAHGSETRWIDAAVDLSSRGGKRVRLRAECVAGGRTVDPLSAVVAWAHPEIVAEGVPRDDRPNVVLISVDTLRADRMPPRSTTYAPAVAGWARRAVVFRNVVAAAPWTLPSHTSMLTGIEPLRHGTNHPFREAPAALLTLAERLRQERGYFTIGMVGGGWLDPSYGLGQGFDRYRSWRDASGSGESELEQHVAALDEVLDTLPRPFFLFLHTYDVHDYLQPGRARLSPQERASPEPRSDAYDRAVRHVDGELGKLFAQLAARGLDADSIVVLTSDHGEALGELGDYGHGSLRDPVLLVPLIIAVPDTAGVHAEIEAQVGLLDLAPTILELAGLELPTGLDGESLVPRLRGERTISHSALAWSYFSAPARGLSLRLGNRLKYTYDNSAFVDGERREGLFLLSRDPREVQDLAATNAAAPVLRAIVERHLTATATGIRLRFANHGATPVLVRIEGRAIHDSSVKTLGQACSCAKLVEEGVAELRLPGGLTYELLLEGSSSGRLAVRLDGASGRIPCAAATLDIQLDRAASFACDTSGWHAGSANERTLGIEVSPSGPTLSSDLSPYEANPDLERQLHSLGYL